MRLKITHRTEYRYDAPVAYALQRLRLMPPNGSTQKVGPWTLAITGGREQLRFGDQFGNDTRLISVEGEPQLIAIEASGTVETTDTAGVSGPHRGFAPLWLFQSDTQLTEAGEGVSSIAASVVSKGDDISRLHHLMGSIRERVAYNAGVTDAETKAEEAIERGEGVCQDHTHIFIAAARRLGFPARYVSGYLKMADTEQAASHAWAEAHVAQLGWVAFDVANGISPDEAYVRVAIGRDYRDAMPVSGIRVGSGEEQLAVRITVEQ
ncbi:transglutaminase family protein [Mesorhizobium sp. RP14(2022)]|uniref:Transglutaminase family protein n=1 Tax=Mesorhizobium liriopis TaxID=2953882 RepID=A0ABT1C765_9HYPH|nr:transglutaminase family protein [Mesorhizobium liriopis]MCO6050667.1 transglutaminase family protein [Mesorhizobium liriopis]